MIISGPVNPHAAHYPFMRHHRLSAMGAAYRFIWRPRFGWRRRFITEPLMRQFFKRRKVKKHYFSHLRFHHHARDIDVDIESADLELAPWPKGYECGSEPDLQILLRALVRDIGVFYDIGANYGFFSLFLTCQKNFTGKTFTFEPTPSTYAHLQKLVGAVDLEKRIQIFPVALSDRDATLSMNCPVETHSGYARIGPSGADTWPVSATTLDHWREEGNFPGPDFVKLDVEGHEAEVLQGSSACIDQYRPFVYYESAMDVAPTVQDQIFSSFKTRDYALYIPTWMYEEADQWCTNPDPVPGHKNHLALIDVSAYKETLHDRRLLRSLNLLACPTEKISLLNERLQALHIG